VPSASIAGIVLAAAVSSASGVFALILAASNADPTVWTTGGIGSAAVGSLLYLIKRMTDGSLVSIKVADVIADAARREDRLRSEAEKRDEALRGIAKQVSADAEAREAKLRDVAKRGQDREDLLWGLLKAKGAIE
jgi:hypothetical protein